MGALRIPLLYTFFFTFCFTLLPAQNSNEERAYINQYTIEANNLIWHINMNMKHLRDYQDELNAWYTDNSRSWSSVPDFRFSPNFGENDLIDLISNTSVVASNMAFNYQTTLLNLHKQTNLFNTFCEELAARSKSGSKDEYYNSLMVQLFQIDEMANDLVNLCYDFSLSCAINYGKEKLPVELNRLKTCVGQSKNVIMAIRDNDPNQVKSYLMQLNNSLASIRLDDRLNDLKRAAKFVITEEEMKEIQKEIWNAANQIAFWAEQYLQSNYGEHEVLPILESAIMSFNVFEGKAGCSGAYNELISFSKNDYLFYTEEAMFFKIQALEKIKDVAIAEVVELVNEPPIVELDVEKETIVAVEEEGIVVVEEVFDESNLNSLAGALSNNLIIMMDVSASMKTTGKLPLLKSSILHLVDIMRPEDRISLIAYSGESETLIKGASVGDRAIVKAVLDTLHSSGGTDIERGLAFAYDAVYADFMQDGNNRIIIATDGKFGVKTALLKMTQENAVNGVVVSVFQFNEQKDNYRNNYLKLLAEAGRGTYEIIKSEEESLEVLIREVKVK